MIKIALKLEELAMFTLGFVGFIYFGGAWWAFFLLSLLPDVSMLGYLVNSRVGSFTYNLFHHKALGILLFLAGEFFGINILTFAGIIIFAHSSIDRVFGYGLKYRDSFNNTHLGKLKP